MDVTARAFHIEHSEFGILDFVPKGTIGKLVVDARITRHYQFPGVLSASQAALLSQRTEASWAAFLATLPPSTLTLDIKVYNEHDDDEDMHAASHLPSMLARIFLHPGGDWHGPDHRRFRIQPEIQINANGSAHYISTAMRAQTRSMCKKAIDIVARKTGKCYWTGAREGVGKKSHLVKLHTNFGDIVMPSS